MKLAIMQPYFFPYIGYFQTIQAVDKYILYGNVNYIKKGWIHRNRILVKQGEPRYILVNIEARSSNAKIYETKLCRDTKWKKKILNLIKYNYSRSAYFQEIFPLVGKIVNEDSDNIHIYNSNCIIKICNYLDISTQIQCSNQQYLEMEKALDDEYGQIEMVSEVSTPQANLDKKTARVIRICKMEGSDVYINPIGGKTLYKKEVFKENGIDLFFIKAQNIFYRQFSNTFIPDLSIIDVLMHCGRDKTREFLNSCKLI
jgi:hypothetical protein